MRAHGVTAGDCLGALEALATMLQESLEERPAPATTADTVLTQIEEHYRTHPHTRERIDAIRAKAKEYGEDPDARRNATPPGNSGGTDDGVINM
jgi:hypothetical protein